MLFKRILSSKPWFLIAKRVPTVLGRTNQRTRRKKKTVKQTNTNEWIVNAGWKYLQNVKRAKYICWEDQQKAQKIRLWNTRAHTMQLTLFAGKLISLPKKHIKSKEQNKKSNTPNEPPKQKLFVHKCGCESIHFCVWVPNFSYEFEITKTDFFFYRIQSRVTCEHTCCSGIFWMHTDGSSSRRITVWLYCCRWCCGQSSKRFIDAALNVHQWKSKLGTVLLMVEKEKLVSKWLSMYERERYEKRRKRQSMSGNNNNNSIHGKRDKVRNVKRCQTM